jgi:hypothetical protein
MYTDSDDEKLEEDEDDDEDTYTKKESNSNSQKNNTVISDFEEPIKHLLTVYRRFKITYGANNTKRTKTYLFANPYNDENVSLIRATFNIDLGTDNNVDMKFMTNCLVNKKTSFDIIREHYQQCTESKQIISFICCGASSLDQKSDNNNNKNNNNNSSINLVSVQEVLLEAVVSDSQTAVCSISLNLTSGKNISQAVYNLNHNEVSLGYLHNSLSKIYLLNASSEKLPMLNAICGNAGSSDSVTPTKVDNCAKINLDSVFFIQFMHNFPVNLMSMSINTENNNIFTQKGKIKINHTEIIKKFIVDNPIQSIFGAADPIDNYMDKVLGLISSIKSSFSDPNLWVIDEKEETFNVPKDFYNYCYSKYEIQKKETKLMNPSDLKLQANPHTRETGKKMIFTVSCKLFNPKMLITTQ